MKPCDQATPHEFFTSLSNTMNNSKLWPLVRYLSCNAVGDQSKGVFFFSSWCISKPLDIWLEIIVLFKRLISQI